jgi:hypothetical protein
MPDAAPSSSPIISAPMIFAICVIGTGFSNCMKIFFSKIVLLKTVVFKLMNAYNCNSMMLNKNNSLLAETIDTTAFQRFGKKHEVKKIVTYFIASTYR